ncbi:MFS transporter [Kutzneria buriramensis]|uniref:Putative MFS family arabinose efflux permease n=1 Tax=Kutzneria buriramensis TaxID=1045776 RepID=A0A3E0I553_9PSEU|nr:MFS transporter [Kutzneria buriramensis]REH53888.1 putative MFS family arabinose efflux permease [Kutzneria buriramensis]
MTVTAATTRLPRAAVFALFLSGFIGILTECLPAGLLPEISHTLATDVALTGQIVTIYALATAVAAIPLSRLTARWNRKTVVLLALAVVAVTNALTALSADYWLTMAIRLVAGMGTAMIWPTIGGYAAAISPRHMQGRAITLALAGTPISLAIGVPVGVWLSRFGGWQVAFSVSMVLAVVNIVWAAATLPDVPGHEPHERFTIPKVLAIPGLRTILLALIAYTVAHNILYTYVTDFLKYANMSSQTGWVLFAFGVTSILSVLVVGTHIDRHLRRLTVGSTVLFGLSVLLLALLAGLPVLVYIAVAAWGFAFGSSPSLFIAGVIKAAGEAAHVAQSITITAISGSIALGGLVGALLIDDLGTASITWASLALVVVAAVAVISAREDA